MDTRQTSSIAQYRRGLPVPEFEVEVQLRIPAKTILRLSTEVTYNGAPFDDRQALVEMAAMLSLTEQCIEELMHSGELIEAIVDAHEGLETESMIASLEGMLGAASAGNFPSTRWDSDGPDACVPYLTRVNLESLIESRSWNDGMLWDMFDFEVAEVALLRDLIRFYLMHVPVRLFMEAIHRRCECLDSSGELSRFEEFLTELRRLLQEARCELEAVEAA